MFNLFKKKNENKNISIEKSDNIKVLMHNNIRVIIEENKKIHQWEKNYLFLYSDENLIDFYYSIYKKYIVDKIDNYKGSVGLDLGCRFGISTVFYSTFLNKKIYAVDFNEHDEIVFEKLKDTKLYLPSKLQYIKNNFKNKALLEIKEKLDWIILYDVLCNTDITKIPLLLNSCMKLLKKDGLIFITDFLFNDNKDYNEKFNNLYYSEIANGTEKEPNGEWFIKRQEYIKNNYPNLLEKEIWSIAYETVGLIYSEIDEYIVGGSSKNDISYINPSYFVNPANKHKNRIGDSVNNLINKSDLLNILYSAGISEEQINLECEENKTGRFYLTIKKGSTK